MRTAQARVVSLYGAVSQRGWAAARRAASHLPAASVQLCAGPLLNYAPLRPAPASANSVINRTRHRDCAAAVSSSTAAAAGCGRQSDSIAALQPTLQASRIRALRRRAPGAAAVACRQRTAQNVSRWPLAAGRAPLVLRSRAASGGSLFVRPRAGCAALAEAITSTDGRRRSAMAALATATFAEPETYAQQLEAKVWLLWSSQPVAEPASTGGGASTHLANH